MNVYFTGSLSAKNTYLPEYLNIIKYLKSQGHSVISEHIIDHTESAVLEKSREETLEFQSQVETWIKECDFMVADTSFPSVSVGFEISLALRMGKPVLVFYGKNGAPSLLTYYKDEKLVVEKYTPDTYKDVIDNFISLLSSKYELRFTFFITPAISSYLDQIVDTQRMPKSVYLRKLIEQEMRNRQL